MDKYEYRVKTEQMLEYMENKDYQKAMEIADTIDWRRVKSSSMLNTVSEIYEYNGEYQKSRDILFVAFDRSPGSRKIVYRLGMLALKINDPEEASDCYEEFVKLAPRDPNQYILKYKILRAQGAPLIGGSVPRVRAPPISCLCTPTAQSTSAARTLRSGSRRAFAYN